jgi:SSU ribosomal protein S18P alanine acetyltransferase (EC 2.3.1.-)
MLLNEMENRFQILGSKYSYLEVDYKNIDAISFYRKHGYIVVGLKRNYYGRIDTPLIMIKPLPSTRVLES